MFLNRLILLTALVPASALAQRETSREALVRLEESVAMRLEDGGLSIKGLLPAMVVSVSPATEETRAWYPNAALASLVRIFGASGLRMCEACMAPRLYVEEGRLEQLSTGLDAVEIVRLDERSRGHGPPAKTAIWLDETLSGVSIRLIDLSNSRILLAENVDPGLSESTRSKRSFTLARELDRRARGESLTHTFIDATILPGQHFSLDWTEQWGDTNRNLSGLTLSMFDPVLGIGGAYYRVVPEAFNVMVGAKVLVSVPTAFVRGISQSDTDLVDPLFTGVLMVRVPIASSNYAATFSLSTNGQLGFGISLMNFSMLPFLP